MKSNIMKYVIMLSPVFAMNAFAGEKEGASFSLPGASVEVNTEYSGSKKEYKEAVRNKQESLEKEGGKAMVNEARQPTKETTFKKEVGIGFKGMGASTSNERSVGTTSAAEEALRNHEKNNSTRK